MIGYSVGRVLALLCLVWSVRHVFFAFAQPDLADSRFILTWTSAWAVVAVLLWLDRGVLTVSAVVLVMCAVELLVFDIWADYAILLIGWLALVLFVAPHHRHDQLVMARILLSTVYAFSALSKIQPAWLMGENLHKLAATRGQAAWLESFLAPPWLWVAAAAVVVIELWLAIGLWFRRTRLLTAVAGVLLHLGLTILATRGGMQGLLHLVALNGGLLLLYPAFWQRLLPDNAPGHHNLTGTGQPDAPAR